jgi:hypothetical protein
MQRIFRRSVPGWCGLVGAVSALVATTMLSGCPGTLDPEIVKMLGSGGGSGSGSGGSTGSGGSGSGGTNPSSGGTGGGTADCTGSNDVNYIIMGTGSSDCPGVKCVACAQSGCHVPGALSADVSGGLDLTLDSNIGSRLIDVMSMGSQTTNGSLCAGKTSEPYLASTSNPPTGLLLDKLTNKKPCGDQMPWPGPPGAIALTSQQIACVSAWAESLIMAAP